MRRHVVTVVLFGALFGFWLALSARLDPLFLGMGALSSGAVAWMTREVVGSVLTERSGPLRLPYRAWRALLYIGWLVGRIVVASAQVAYLALHPRMPLDPGVLHVRSSLRHPLARTIFANSITLVPGTMTVEVIDDTFVVHALFPEAAEDLLTGKTQTMIGTIFLERSASAPEASWARRERTE
jgi:multicomponent Na+:H+ antiporter subunit E